MNSRIRLCLEGGCPNNNKPLPCVVPMEAASPKGSSTSVASSPYSSPNISALLKIRVLSWSQETGLPASVRVRLRDRDFNFHKFPLSSRSGYFKQRLIDSAEVEILESFPGGPETFEKIMLFSYGSSTLVDPSNVAALRCAAEFLQMTEDHWTGNLCQRFDLYLNQVVLQNWDDTLIVLQKCQDLLPWTENLLIVSRCIESLAFMACMEILDPERRQGRPVAAMLETMADCTPWSYERVKEIMSRDLWIKGLISLPFAFFRRIVGSLRRQGMKEKYVSPLLVFYANNSVLSDDFDKNELDEMVPTILQGLIHLLPMGEKAGRMIPVGFYLVLLSRCLEFGSTGEVVKKLQDQVASMLPLAHLDELIFPKIELGRSVSCSIELATMEAIFSAYVSSDFDSPSTPPVGKSVAADLWDAYLASIAIDPNLSTKSFTKLVETVPLSHRLHHDALYRSLNSFLQSHRDATQEEKAAVCKYLSCQKLSQEVCIEAVQNELMPLRLIVQALFIQQLNTHQAFKECSDSFRYTKHYGEFSGSIPSSRSPFTERDTGRMPLSILLQADYPVQGSDIPHKEYESTSFRIQSLEQELMSLKRSLRGQNNLQTACHATRKPQDTKKLFGVEKTSTSRGTNLFGQMTSCIGSGSGSANRLLKLFRRMNLFGTRKKEATSGLSSQPPQSKNQHRDSTCNQHKILP